MIPTLAALAGLYIGWLVGNARGRAAAQVEEIERMKHLHAALDRIDGWKP